MIYLYDIIIRPIEILIEIIFTLLYRFFERPGVALIAVSIVVSFMVLPLYLRADRIQEEEQQRVKRMQRWISHIRKHFDGDEKYMIQNAYYREQGYRPLYALRGTLSILLQIPFFMAAYHYLSSASVLNGCSFGSIADLSKPDGLVMISGIQIHVLPIMMTVINCISGAIYTKGYTLRQKSQVYILAVVFLILLYNSPSGLVIYWTMNNIFSLAKNIVIKYIKEKRLFLSALFAMMGVFLLAFSIMEGKLSYALMIHDNESVLVCLLCVTLLCVPMLIYVTKRHHLPLEKKFMKRDSVTYEKEKVDNLLFTSIVMVLFCGLLVPLSVVSSSPLEFVNTYHYKNPLWIVLTVTAMFAGILVVWGYLVIYPMMSRWVKCWYAQGLFAALLVMLMNFYCFHAEMGTCGMELNFIYEPHFYQKPRYGNMILVLLLIIGSIILYKKGTRICRYMMIVLSAAIIVQSGQMMLKVLKEVDGIETASFSEDDEVKFPLSRNGKNVVVIMLDRAMAGYVPFILEERPELKDKFDGFTFYPNTVSSGMWTGVGSPAIFGGYEYLAENLNKRKTETIAEKHNQALKLMPKLFSDAGFHVTVSDLPYVGYQEIPDYSIYDGMNVSHFLYKDHFSSAGDWEGLMRKVERNLFMYSLMRTAPAFMQDNIYDQSCYLTGDGATTDQSIEHGQAYRALAELPDYTEITDEKEGEVILYTNFLTHEPAYMQLPDYTYSQHVHNEGYEFETRRELDGVVMDLEQGDYHPTEHYFVNASALLRLGEWFDMLRENGVYDNTRIILVADHGRLLGQFNNMTLENGMDVQAVNILFMVKDFDSSGFTIDEHFMTNADVPLIALEDIVSDPINPYTGIKMTSEEKENGIDVFTGANMGMLPGNEILPQGTMVWHVKDDIFKEENWTQTEAP